MPITSDKEAARAITKRYGRRCSRMFRRLRAADPEMDSLTALHKAFTATFKNQINVNGKAIGQMVIGVNPPV